MKKRTKRILRLRFKKWREYRAVKASRSFQKLKSVLIRKWFKSWHVESLIQTKIKRDKNRELPPLEQINQDIIITQA